jgi:hypothetical protein
MKKNEESSILMKALIDLYLSLRARSIESVGKWNQLEEVTLAHTDPLFLIQSIKSSIELLLNAKEGSSNGSFALLRSQQDTYEEQLQSLEAKARMHVRVIYQVSK